MSTEKIDAPKVKDSGRSRRITELLDISARLFRKKGYAATSMQEIALEAGLLKGSLYHYIATKEDLLWLISQPTLTDLIESVDAALNDKSLSFSDRIRKSVAIHVDKFDTRSSHMAVVAREGESSLGEARKVQLHALQKQYYDVWHSALRKAKRAGDIDDNSNTAILTYAILGMINWMLRWYNPGGTITPREITDQFTRLIVSGVSPSQTKNN